MLNMKIQQAVFSSSDRGQIKGYQIVAMSEGIDRSILKELQRWSPSHMTDDDPSKWTINYFPVSEDRVAVTRTVLGGPEYSSRGGSQVVTLIAVLDNQQFAAYENNALLVVRNALALGWLRVPSNMSSRLEAFELPDYPLIASCKTEQHPHMNLVASGPLVGSALSATDEQEIDIRMLRGLIELLESKKRIAIVGARRPIILAETLIQSLPVEGRREFSFTTGLLPALYRPFQAHFLSSTTPVINQSLKSEGVTLIELPCFLQGH